MIRKNGSWKNLDEVEFATLEWSTGSIASGCSARSGDVPSVQFEANYYAAKEEEVEQHRRTVG